MPRKLGQHFLIRDSILERLAKAACGDHTAHVVEIGPGRGALTRHLLPRVDELHAVELDQKLVDYLKVKFAGEPKLRIYHGNVLSFDLSQWGPAVIAGNLPYYITSPVIEQFLALDHRFTQAVFLVQLEVAERLSAKPGSRAYGYLTVAAQLACAVELLMRVPAGAFAPPPAVDSAAIRLRRKEKMPDDMGAILQFAARCFAQKRKTLRNNLRPVYGSMADELPEGRLRAEQLTIDQFIELRSRIEQLR